MSSQHGRRLLAYGLMVIALCTIGLAVPRAWATPEQGRSGQGGTVPTPTPKKIWSPSPPPSHDAPSATPEMNPPTPFTPTPVNATIPTPSTTRAETGAFLALTQTVAPLLVWPGVRVDYVLMLQNAGTTSVRQVVLEDALPDGLDPGAIQSPSATWEGRTLRGRIPVLPPGGQVVIKFSAIVRAGAGQGGLLVNTAQATAVGAPVARAETAIALPPVALPVVGDAAGR